MTDSTVETNHRVSQEIDYLRLFKILLSRWYWVAGSVFICVLIAYISLRFTQATYQTSALLKFDDKKTEISELININSYYDRRDKIQSEIYVLQSRTLLLNAVGRMNYQISFFRKGSVLQSETYPFDPFEVIPVMIDSSSLFATTYTLRQIDPRTFKLSYPVGENVISKNYSYSDTIRVGSNAFSITKSNLPAADKDEFVMYFNHPQSFVGRLTGGLMVREVGKGVNIMALTFTDKNAVYAADALNAIIQEYRIFDRTQKGLAAAQTIEFIDEQLLSLGEQVKDAERQLEEFKSGKSILNIEDNKNIAYENIKDLEVQKNLIKIQGISIDLLEDQIKTNKETLSFSFSTGGIEDGQMKELVNQMNNLLGEKIKRLSLYAENSTPVQEIDKQIEEVKKSIIYYIQAARSRNNRTIAYLDSRLEAARSQLKEIPAAERDLLNLQRDFEINEKVYSYLLEKRLEASIAKSAIMSASNVIDPAIPNFGVASPNSKRVYTLALFIGFLTGIALIVAARLLNQRIFDKETVEHLTSVPIIGVIRNFPGKIDKNSSQILSLSNPKSLFSESVRSVRTNLSFLAGDVKNKVICVTSEVSGEGKSFVVINLASTLSLINKKVVVIDGDLRKSKLHHTFNLKNELGLTSYLSNQVESDAIVQKTSVGNLYFIAAGPMPPNPSELLYSDRMRSLIVKLKEEFDYVIIDTAPIGLVSDSIPLVRSSDINIFILRSGVSTFNAASIPERISREYGLSNSVIVLNGFTNDPLHARIHSGHRKGSYGSGQYYYTDYSTYGGKNYGYYSEGINRSRRNKLLIKIRNLLKKDS